MIPDLRSSVSRPGRATGDFYMTKRIRHRNRIAAATETKVREVRERLREAGLPVTLEPGKTVWVGPLSRVAKALRSDSAPTYAEMKAIPGGPEFLNLFMRGRIPAKIRDFILTLGWRLDDFLLSGSGKSDTDRILRLFRSIMEFEDVRDDIMPLKYFGHVAVPRLAYHAGGDWLHLAAWAKREEPAISYQRLADAVRRVFGKEITARALEFKLKEWGGSRQINPCALAPENYQKDV
jgi:hypothetical protein